MASLLQTEELAHPRVGGSQFAYRPLLPMESRRGAILFRMVQPFSRKGTEMTTLELTIGIIKEMNDPSICENCRNWVPAGNLHQVNGSINDRAFGRANRDREVVQTVWLCTDCYDQNN